VLGCASPPVRVVFPLDKAVLANPVHLEATQSVVWLINQKPVGEGKTWSGNLPEGKHQITAHTSASKSSIGVYVEADFPLGKPRSLPSRRNLDLPEGAYALVWGNTAEAMLSTNAGEPIRQLEAALLQRPQRKAQPIRALNLSTERVFRVVNLEGGHTLETARLIWSGAHILAYSTVSSPEALQVAQLFDQRLMRIKQAFGAYADVDQNGKVIVLFTPKINATKQAVGFFYAADLLAQGPANPDSNQAEILYLGVPEANPNFSVASLTATACHELQHLINFSNTTLPYITNAQPPVSPLWLNEGMSHLAEDLCGYNIRGGNIAFVARFLQKPWETSLTSSNLHGQGDSVERRGAAYLFLRYWTEQQGGYSPGTVLQDKGGLQFLRALSRTTGLDDIAKLVGVSNRELLWRWWWALVQGSYQAPIPEEDDQHGLNLNQGQTAWGTLEGLQSPPVWPKRLVGSGFAFASLTGPLTTQLPPGEVQILRLR
jgi:hypothetical protein